MRRRVLGRPRGDMATTGTRVRGGHLGERLGEWSAAGFIIEQWNGALTRAAPRALAPAALAKGSRDRPPRRAADDDLTAAVMLAGSTGSPGWLAAAQPSRRGLVDPEQRRIAPSRPVRRPACRCRAQVGQPHCVAKRERASGDQRRPLAERVPATTSNARPRSAEHRNTRIDAVRIAGWVCLVSVSSARASSTAPKLEAQDVVGFLRRSAGRPQTRRSGRAHCRPSASPPGKQQRRVHRLAYVARPPAWGSDAPIDFICLLWANQRRQIVTRPWPCSDPRAGVQDLTATVGPLHTVSVSVIRRPTWSR